MLTEDSPDCSMVPVGDGERVLVSSTDFLSPISQDPFHQGWIAAANTLSDLYAVGADDINNILMILTVIILRSPILTALVQVSTSRPALTTLSHWVSFIIHKARLPVTCVPRGFVRTMTLPGTARSVVTS
mmetsp:Transcript_24734/g.24482  ORF Transcript_24734/g.24482 Transcript_24734/m.24482 type:complete len:130 (+) Transcript_24734:128-517(+)